MKEFGLGFRTLNRIRLFEIPHNAPSKRIHYVQILGQHVSYATNFPLKTYTYQVYYKKSTVFYYEPSQRPTITFWSYHKMVTKCVYVAAERVKSLFTRQDPSWVPSTGRNDFTFASWHKTQFTRKVFSITSSANIISWAFFSECKEKLSLAKSSVIVH